MLDAQLELPSLFPALDKQQQAAQQQAAQPQPAQPQPAQSQPAELQPAQPQLAEPRDAAARGQALDIDRSWIVQAPAGSGKTELLTERFLALLAKVDEPEEILAITFTRAATAEMRVRILGALEQAAALPGTPLPGPAEPNKLFAARAALARSEERGWQLLQQPHRLDIQTIDSLCLRLAHGQPLLARLGGQLEPAEQANGLYQVAAQRTLARLGSGPEDLDSALRHLLLLRDNNLGNCQRLLAGMLECREQWSRLLILGAAEAATQPDPAAELVTVTGLDTATEPAPAAELVTVTGLDTATEPAPEAKLVTAAEPDPAAEARAQLEEPFAEEVRRVLGEAHAILHAEPMLVAELLELARYACANTHRPATALLDGLQALPAAEVHFVAHWTCLHHFLLTNGAWRKGKGFNKHQGFPIEGTSIEKKQMRAYKDRMESLMRKLIALPAGERLRALLAQVPALPAARFDDEQWHTLVSVFRVLRHAVAELHVVFAERNQVDFAALSIAASTVLHDEESTSGLLASEARKHLLIDEFQDTSRRQHQLIGRLLREWQPGDGRTCFLVGDPMQSIYIFRQAEVELFGRVQRRGFDCGTHTHPCAELTLSENFRSHAGLVDPLNRFFETILRAEAGTEAPPDIPFSPSTAARPGGDAVDVHTFFIDPHEPASKQAARTDEIARVVAIVEQEQVNLAAAVAGGTNYTVAILGRARNHLIPIAASLRERGLPFRAVELETLGERQEILDLLSLLRALLHPADRIAWLSVLRAPWCGLKLGDLHRLTGADDPAFRYTPVRDLIADRACLLSPDGRERLARTAEVLERAAAERFRHRAAPSLSAWLERTWTSLGAPAYLCPDERENAEVFFSLLDTLAPSGVDALNGTLEAALAQLCATPDATVGERCGVQLMTIHKAKGLGFDVVIVPALERATGRDGTPLIAMLERAHAAPDAGEEADQLLVAPLGPQGTRHPTYAWVQGERKRREEGERKRLFYVACTRARQRLHLLGAATIKATAELRGGDPGSLLACAWPALKPYFEAQRIKWQRQETQDSEKQPHEARRIEAPVHEAQRIETQPAQPAPSSGLSLVPAPGEHAQPGVVQRLAAEAHAGTANAAEDGSSPETLKLLRVPSGFSARILGSSGFSGVSGKLGVPGIPGILGIPGIPGVYDTNVTVPGTHLSDAAPGKSGGSSSFVRPGGSFEQRARGTAIHAMLELVAELWAEGTHAGDRAAPGALEPQLARLARAVLRESGLAPARVAALGATLVPLVLRAAAHPHGRWVLAPHREARSEWSLSAIAASGGEAEQRNLRIDRAFRAGDAPGVEGSDYLWIIDYKTGAEPGSIALGAYLQGQKEQWRPQLEAYGAALRALYGIGAPPLRYALFFPELLQLTAWSE